MSDDQTVVDDTTTTDDAQVDQSLVQDNDSLVQDTQNASWFYDENMAGVGDRPDFLMEKFANVAEQAKSFVELEKKFGSFKGAPKDGYSLPDGVTTEDALVAEVVKFGETHNMSQDGFTELLDLAFAQADVTQEVSRDQEMSRLGSNADARISRVDGFLRNTFEAEDYDKIAPMLTTASHIELVEMLITGTGQETLPVEEVQTTEGVSFDEYMDLLLAKDEHGNSLYNTNPTHKAKCDKIKAELEAKAG